MGARLQVARQVVVRKRQYREGEHVRRRDQLHQRAQLLPGRNHDLIIPGCDVRGARREARGRRLAVSGRKTAYRLRHTAYDTMFPLSDVIPSRTVPLVTIALIAMNALVFLHELLLPTPLLEAFIQRYALIPAWFSWPTVFTSMFLHAGFWHVLGNMVYLWIFGDNVEDRLGHARYLGFYLTAGVVAAIAQVIISPFSAVPMVGASGAIAGVMGAYFVLYPQSRVLTAVFILIFFDVVEIPAIFFLGLWFLLQLLSGVGSLGVSNAAGGGTAFFAHIGGFIVGAIVGLILRARDRRWEYYGPGY
jgi:membrane associated rhomboid family serine protease